MRREVESAVTFLSNILRNRLNVGQVETFGQALQLLLCAHYQDHWFPEKPMKGSGYRCIRINHNMDPLLAQAGGSSGLTEDELFNLFPKELTMWIDPAEVCYRIGEDGSVGVIFGEGADESSDTDYDNSTEQFSSGGTSPARTPSPQDNSPHTSDFLHSCKLWGLGGETSVDTIHYLQSHLATFVAS